MVFFSPGIHSTVWIICTVRKSHMFKIVGNNFLFQNQKQHTIYFYQIRSIVIITCIISFKSSCTFFTHVVQVQSSLTVTNGWYQLFFQPSTLKIPSNGHAARRKDQCRCLGCDRHSWAEVHHLVICSPMVCDPRLGCISSIGGQTIYKGCKLETSSIYSAKRKGTGSARM